MNSRKCLDKIQISGDYQAQVQLTQLGYVGMLASTISTAGGCGETNCNNILETLSFFVNFSIFYERQQQSKNNQNFSPLTFLLRSSKEQFEIEGGSKLLNGFTSIKTRYLTACSRRQLTNRPSSSPQQPPPSLFQIAQKTLT
ncbi:MAG: hypothetical protein EZS28_015015 [Streblomastix strix]|uniref:Uncharacterized protein n=1 Tax=Streblomastix strix TaxID=222440 RepID=A0A5J4W3J8_9EUKA|nr:MAG: hypothetical protein EZS28_015015 [Streblomastix strix]